MTHTTARNEQLDFLKCVFIVLMIAFHLVAFSETYPYAKQMVYTFHMPGFLLISGYLHRCNKEPKLFMKSLLWMLVPYLVMESGYLLMASILPIREHIDHLSLSVFCRHLFLDPIGPYWFLHTLILCKLLSYIVTRLAVKASLISRFVIIALLFYALAKLGLMPLAYSMYFLAGFLIASCSLRFDQLFKASLWALPALMLLFSRETWLHCHKVSGVLIVYLVISLLLLVFSFLRGKTKNLCLYLGRNSLVIYLFSPIFTILCKFMLPLLAFDKTMLLFLMLSLVVCVAGSLAIAKVMDILHLSRFLFGKEKVLE